MINNYPIIDIYEKPEIGSNLSSQMLYGEKFKIISKKKNWLKIRTNFDNYVGYIKNKKFLIKSNPKFKIYSLKSEVFCKPKNKFKKTGEFLFFASRISKISENKKFLEFEKNKWVKKSNLKKINHIEKNYNKLLRLFLNTKYLWGGKSARGIDCSSLVQIYFYYNSFFFPRDTKDQIKYCKKKIKKKYSAGDIIFWKGHVGVCLNKSKFIHAYGPKKKVLIMPINYTIQLIEKTAKLLVKKISNIKNF
jgi:cell wall-associated NlpC family hydrolase